MPSHPRSAPPYRSSPRPPGRSHVPGRLVTAFAAACAASLALGACSLPTALGPGGAAALPMVVPDSKPLPLSEQKWTLTLELAASPELNPDRQGLPSPIRVHVFLAEPSADPSRLTFDKVFDPIGGLSPNATLTLDPGTSTRLELDGVRTRTRLSVAAEFRDPYLSAWIDSRVVRPDDKVHVTARIDAQRVSIE